MDDETFLTFHLSSTLVARSKGGEGSGQSLAREAARGVSGGFFAINSPPFHCSVLSLISNSKLAGDPHPPLHPTLRLPASCSNHFKATRSTTSIRATVTARQSPSPCVPKQCSASQGRQACRTCTEQRQGVLAAPARPRAVSL